MNKITTLAEYQQLAARTCSDLGSPEENLLHMNLGIITEIGEFLDPIKKNLAYKKPLDKVNLGEELADAAWYIANRNRLLAPIHWSQIEDAPEIGFKALIEDFDKHFGKLEKIDDVIQAALGVQPDAEEFDVHNLAAFMGTPTMAILYTIAQYYELDFFQLLTNNIEKLKIRYPEKFTEEKALNRDLNCERQALEKDI